MTKTEPKYRAGQIATVRLRFDCDCLDDSRPISMGTLDTEWSFYVHKDDIVSVEPETPEPLKVGDEVYRFDSSKDRGTFHLVAIDGDEAWCRFPAGDHTTFSLSDLVRA